METKWEQDYVSKPFGVVSNESLRVCAMRNEGLRTGDVRQSFGRDERSRKKRSRGTPNRSRQPKGVVVIFEIPQEVGQRCVKFLKEQRSKLHIIRRCTVMLACWPKYR